MRPSPEQDVHHRGGRRKGAANRQWLVVSSSGCSHFEEVGKHSIMKRTGLPGRDLRVLDPLLSYPSTILGRERAIVINLEHIKAIVTATEVLVPNSKDPMVGPFLQDLQARVSRSGGVQNQATSGWPSVPGNERAGHDRTDIFRTKPTSGNMPGGSSGQVLNSCEDGGTKVLSFEFRALEVCLESACRCLETETSTLEKEAYPALDELTSKVSTLNLERVRQLKSRLVAISGRVQKVRDELEHLLDDEMDMAEMYLSDKLAHQSVTESLPRFDVGNNEIGQDDERDADIRSEAQSSPRSSGGYKPNVEELEMLLEAYFVQIDGTLNKLSHLREYVDDTEDYINIMLDDKQNQLLQMGVILSTGTVILTAGIVAVSIFGMNIGISLYDAPYSKFWETTFGTVGGCIGLYVVAIGWGKKSGLIQ